MDKKITLLIFIVLILFAVIIAITQETFFNISSVSEANNISLNWARPPVWFRSNQGGMALEEISSRIVALRNEYALSISFARPSDTPVFLSRYMDVDFYSEIRVLYKDGEIVRTQWILKDINGITRLNASFSEPEKFIEEIFDETSRGIENVVLIDTVDNMEGKTGFIEIFNMDSLLTEEYRFFSDGIITRIENEYNNNLLISSVFSIYESENEYKRLYADFYRYNRSMSLRSIERIFYSATRNDDESIMISFPRRVMDSANDGAFISGRINLYPEYFGGIILEENKIIYDTDTRGRILIETLYDEEDNIIWFIQNIWENNRIISSEKIEADMNYLTEYEYSSGGEKVLERNYKNGVLERIVRREGFQDIEELYINDIMVMTAVWENGRKISESRVRQEN
ncbi:MAG: hypothetical protein FWC21_00225 [Treponema sp.]|nr:hypothetical protein [Treponema sp.]